MYKNTTTEEKKKEANMVMKGGKVVRWTSEEISALVASALSLYLLDPGERNLWEIIATDGVQAVLPQNRRRKITGWASLPDSLEAEFKAAVAKFVQEQNRPPEVYEVEKEVIVEPPPRDVRELLDSVSHSELLEALARRTASIVEGIANLQRLVLQAAQVSTVVQPVVRPPMPKVAETPPTVRSPKVNIYGFLDSQEADVREKAAGFKLELVFINTEGKLQRHRPSASWHIVNLSKVGHQHTDSVSSSSSGQSRIIKVRGIDGLMKTLADINAKVGAGER